MPQEVKPAFLPQSQNRNTGFFNFGGGGGAGGFSGILGSAIKTFADAGISAARDLAFGPTEEEKTKQIANNTAQFKTAAEAFSQGNSDEEVAQLVPELTPEQRSAIKAQTSNKTRAYKSQQEADTLKKLQDGQQAQRMAPVVAGGSAIGEQVSAPVTAESKANISQMKDTQTSLDKSLEYAPSETAALIDPQAKNQGMGTNQVADETSNLMMDYSPEHPEFIQAKNDMVSHLSANPERVKLAAAADENFGYLLESGRLEHLLNWQHAANSDRTVMASGQFSPREAMKTQEDQQMMSLSKEIFSNWKDTRLVAMGLPPTLIDDAPLDAVLQSLAFRDPTIIQAQETAALGALAQAKANEKNDPEGVRIAQENLNDIAARKELAERGTDYLKTLPISKRASLELFLSGGPLKGAVAASKSAAGLKSLISYLNTRETTKTKVDIANTKETGINSRHADTMEFKNRNLDARIAAKQEQMKATWATLGFNMDKSKQELALKLAAQNAREADSKQKDAREIMKMTVGIGKTKATMANSRLAAAEKQLADAQKASKTGLQTTAKKAESAKQIEALTKNIEEQRSKYQEAIAGLDGMISAGHDSPPVIYGPDTPEYYENVLDVDMSNLDPETGLKLSKSIASLLKGKAQPTLGQYDVFLKSQGYSEDQRKTALKMYQEGLKNNGVISK